MHEYNIVPGTSKKSRKVFPSCLHMPRGYLECYKLFLSKEEAYGHAGEFKLLAQLVLEIIFIRLLYIVGEIAEESKRWHMRRQLCYIFYANGVAAHNRRLIRSNGFQHYLIQL